jgi:hypothetical protein
MSDRGSRLIGAIVLTGILWTMVAVPYLFVFIVPQPLQVALFMAAAISAFVFVLDWLVDRRRP